MPRGRKPAAVKGAEPKKVEEPVKPVEPEKIELDETEELEEEIEYEEVEEEVEEEVIEEEELEDEEDDAEEASPEGVDVDADDPLDEEMKDEEDQIENENKEHAELLSLPPHGSEIYVGGVAYNAAEEELKSFCETVGEVTEVRMMKGKDSNDGNTYAFVTFRTKELAIQAIKDLSNTEFKGKKIKCSTSQAKHRLFVGNVPRHWVEDDLRKEVAKIGPGIVRVELLKDSLNSNRNRGFAFIEYYNHACADYSRKKMSNPTFKLESNAPTVSWADPKSGDSSVSQQVKSIYVKNIPKNTTRDQLGKLFKRHGEITKVVLPQSKPGQENRFGFVHFAERSSAMKALKNTEKYEIDGQLLECSLAKPQLDRKGGDPVNNSQKGPLIPNYTSQMAYGIMGGAYGAGYGQPMMFGGGSPAMAAMVPMILPDGRFAYVMQQPGHSVTPPPPPRPAKDGSRGSGSGGSRHSGENIKGRRFRPY